MAGFFAHAGKVEVLMGITSHMKANAVMHILTTN